jgi:tetratricopeptide (TPR) repeat protein
VDKLYEEHGSYSQVIDKLKADRAIDEPIRKVALQIIDTRQWEYGEKLLNEAGQVLLSPDHDRDEYRAALEKIQQAEGLMPDSPIVPITLGIAQYRLGAYENALETLNRCGTTSIAYFDRAAAAFTAMTLHQLGRFEEAKTSLEGLRDAYEEGDVRSFLTEAERLIDGEDKERQ